MKITMQKIDLGLNTILKTENSVAISHAVFSQDTGERLEDNVEQIFPDKLKVEKETLQTRMNEIDAILAKIDATPLIAPEPVLKPTVEPTPVIDAQPLSEIISA